MYRVLSLFSVGQSRSHSAVINKHGRFNLPIFSNELRERAVCAFGAIFDRIACLAERHKVVCVSRTYVVRIAQALG